MVFVLLQVVFWHYTKEIRPQFDIVSRPPTERQVDVMSLGDSQFLFRVLGFELQNFGDTFGRSTPLKDYDFKVLQNWFFVMDRLDPISNLIPAVAVYYYANSQRVDDCRYIIEYIEKRFDRNPAANWWWMASAVTMADYKLKDEKLALRLAEKLSKVEGSNIPLWVRQMPAFIHEKRGEKEAAKAIMLEIVKNYEDLSDKELNFMRYFIEERIKETAPELLKR